MPESRPRCPSGAALGKASRLLPWLCPAACGGAAAADGAAAAAPLQWLFVVLAFIVACGGAFVLGSWRERARAQRALQRSAAERTAWRLLQRAATWHTDAAHALVGWQAAGGGAPPVPAARAGVRANERPVRAHRLAAAAGTTAWLLDGEPVRDALGGLAGFRGSARPASEADEARLLRAALGAIVAAWPGPAVLAVGSAARLRVLQSNEAARVHWPRLQGGDELEPLLAALPARVALGLAGAAAQLGAGGAGAAESDGWQCTRFALGADAEGALLARIAPAGGSEAEAFGQTLSHDLRAPIRVVEGFTRIVKEDYGRQLDRVANDHLDRVLGAAARMNLMIDALLTLARLSTQPLARQPVNLSQLAGFVVEDLRRGTAERSVEVDIEPGLAAQGDPTLLRLVLENLLGNAWKYTARTPRARIVLRRGEHEGRVCFQVVDNGAGFDMRSADRLFGLFQRLHSQADFAGHGVGLASVRRIVQRHGGEIWAQAEPGRGATFSFTLA
ncbi:MAG: ATP-binding protein [Rubrivivax sp.]